MSSTRPVGTYPQLAIKLSDSIIDRPCVLCGLPCYPFEGPELFLADGWELVCWVCGETIAPDLVDMLAAFWDVTEEMLRDEEQLAESFKHTPAA